MQIFSLFILLTVFYKAKVFKKTFSSNAHGQFSRINHVLGHKTNLNKFKRIEIMPHMFFSYSGMKSEINSKRKSGKFPKMYKIKLLNQWVKKQITRENKKYFVMNENENIIY